MLQPWDKLLIPCTSTPNSPCTHRFLQQMRLLPLPQSCPLHQIHFPSHPILSQFLVPGLLLVPVPLPRLLPFFSPSLPSPQVLPNLPPSRCPLLTCGAIPPLPSSAPAPLASPKFARCHLSLPPPPPHPSLPTPSPSSSPQRVPAGGQGQRPSSSSSPQPLPLIKAVWDEPVHGMPAWGDTLRWARTAGFVTSSIAVGPGQDRGSSLLLLAPS